MRTAVPMGKMSRQTDRGSGISWRQTAETGPGRIPFCPGKGGNMERVVMTADELREYVRCLPEHVILQVTIREVHDGAEETEEL